jgi:hypothetical protein
LLLVFGNDENPVEILFMVGIAKRLAVFKKNMELIMN